MPEEQLQNIESKWKFLLPECEKKSNFKKKKLKKFLPFFSYVFHPIFIPILGTFFYVLISDTYFSSTQYIILFSQIFIVTFLLPIAFFYLLRTFGKVDGIMLSDISQRRIPLILQMALFSTLVTRSITADLFSRITPFFFGRFNKYLHCLFATFCKNESQYSHDWDECFNNVFNWVELSQPS